MSSEVLKNGHGPSITLSEVSESLAELESLETPLYTDDGLSAADGPPVVEIGRDLDTLTYSGSTINDLEVQLTHSKNTYQRVLVESKRVVEGLRRKLNSHIRKSEPFIEIWRRARQIQEESNKAAMRYDKANSQHAASKEMIRMAESQLGGRVKTEEVVDPSSPSPLDLAWQEMLNHATLKVVETERERRASELEHRSVLERVQRVMEEYRGAEKRLRNHIIKSRPYYEERYRANQRLAQLKHHMQELERKIDESKQTYTNTLKKLELLNTEIHHRRALSQTIPRVQARAEPWLSSSTGCSPRQKHRDIDTDSLDSVQVPMGFTGSIGSLPTFIGGISPGSSPSPPLNTTPDEPITTPDEQITTPDEPITHSTNGEDPSLTQQSKLMTLCASQLVSECLAAAIQHVEQDS